MNQAQRNLAGIGAFALGYAALSLSVDNAYWQLILTLVPIWALMGLSWNLFSGYSGLVSFGHAAFFGLGAYCVALCQVHWNLSPWFGVPLAGVVGGLGGLLVGLPTFRLRGHYFALAMLAYPLALLYVFEWLGYQELALPMRRETPLAAMQFHDPRLYTWLALTLLIAAMLLSFRLERGRFGMALAALKQDEAAAEASGIDTLRWKLKAITLSAFIAGLTGGLYAVVLLVVTPTAVFGMLVSAQALIVAMFGGAGTFWGPVIGACVLVPLSEFLHAQLGASFPGIQGVVYGLAIVAVILFAPEGVFWRLRDTWLRRRGLGDAPAHPPPALRPTTVAAVVPHIATAPGSVLLKVHALSKSFGGVKAVDEVSFEVARGEILGIIGPNGAGKTTLFNLLNGFILPDSGSISFEGHSLLGAKPHEVCAAGIGRTFQVVRPFRRMSAAHNVSVGAYVRMQTAGDAERAAHAALAQAGLALQSQRIAGEMSNKELRLLELARALAGAPKLLLLDETLAGLSVTEAAELLAVIRELAQQGMTIIIIEHTMSAMVRLVDRFIVLNHGALLTSGAPAQITRDPAVIEAYLGPRWREAHAGA